MNKDNDVIEKEKPHGSDPCFSFLIYNETLLEQGFRTHQIEKPGFKKIYALHNFRIEILQ